MLATKLSRPRVPRSFVDRAHVAALLESGTRGPVTVVSAGAGWGKTLTTAAWASSGPVAGPVAWLSLDEADNEPRAFWGCVLAALRRTIALPPENPLVGLDPALGREDENLRRLTSGLAELPSSVVLVIDDFHLIQDAETLAGLSGILRHPLSQLRLVLLTRADPALALHRLRLNGELCEIRSGDLAFDAAEAAQLLSEDGVDVVEKQAEVLVDRTEGWPAGLRLAALFLSRDNERTVAEFGGDDRAVTDYLLEEVLASQPRDIRDFLTQTSVVERVSADLAAVLTDQPQSQQFLETLEMSNAFVVGLGTDRQWFRYHPLLREMLHHRLSVSDPALAPELHRRAARWFAEAGQSVEALRHAALAADWSLFGRLFADQGAPLLVSADRLAIGRMLAKVPVQRFADSAEMELCAAGLLFHENRIPEMRAHLDRVAVLVEEATVESSVGARIGHRLLTAALARHAGDIPTLIGTSRDALDLVSGAGVVLPAATEYRCVALGNLGTGLLWSGHPDEAERRLREALVTGEDTQLEAARINVWGHLGVITATSGRLHEAFGHAQRAIDLVGARGWAPLPQASAAYLALAMANLRWNRVDEALSGLEQGQREASLDLVPLCALAFSLAGLHASEGRPAAARDELHRLRHELDGWEPSAYLARWGAVTEAEIDLAEGDHASALHKLRVLEATGGLLPAEKFCLARALLAGGETNAADAVLLELRDGERTGVEVDVWVLSALVADRLREDNRALDALQRAVELARSEGVRRPFVALAPEHVRRLLGHLQQVDPGSDAFVRELVAELTPEDRGVLTVETLSENLTDRELSVLRYLPSMMTNEEIAGELFVSVNTVKAHLKRIYRKLGVVSRREAVRRAHELGMIGA